MNLTQRIIEHVCNEPSGPEPIRYDPMDPDNPDFWIWRIGEDCFLQAATRTPFASLEAVGPLPWPAWLWESESHTSQTENRRRNPGWRPDGSNTAYAAGQAYAAGYHD